MHRPKEIPVEGGLMKNLLDRRNSGAEESLGPN